MTNKQKIDKLHMKITKNDVLIRALRDGLYRGDFNEFTATGTNPENWKACAEELLEKFTKKRLVLQQKVRVLRILE